MDKNHYFPVFYGTKKDPVKVVCNCDGFGILSAVGFVKTAEELPDSAEEKKETRGRKPKSVEIE